MSRYITSLARNYVRSRATDIMEYSCRVERLSAGSYDDDDLIYNAGTRVTLYEGKFRLWEITNAANVNLGGEELLVESTQASFPYDTPLFNKDDEIVITAAPIQDEQLLGARYQIQTKAKAGELRATRRYTVSGVQRKRP